MVLRSIRCGAVLCARRGCDRRPRPGRKRHHLAAAWDSPSGGRSDLHPEPEFFEPTDETAGDLFAIAAIEVVRAQIPVLDPIAEHVVGRRQHRRATASTAFFGPRRLLSRRNW